MKKKRKNDSPNSPTLLRSLWRDRTLVLMALPAVVVLILFSYVPMTGLVLAFKKFNYSLGLYRSPWNGIKNIMHLFSGGTTFWRITRNTVAYYALFTSVCMVFNVALALLINECKFSRLGKYSHMLMILPSFVSAVATTYIVSALLGNENGMVNKLLVSLGHDRINFYVRGEYWPFILTTIRVWAGTGYGAIIYLSTLAGIDQQLYEAAALDGVTAWQRIRFISLPMLRPVVSLNLLLSLANIMISDTGLFYRVTKNSGPLYEYTQTIDAYVLQAIMKSSDFGITAAVTLYQSVIGCLMLVTVNAIVRKLSPDDALF